eukprot:3969394-Pleurochrysis_carterae.AAC.1
MEYSTFMRVFPKALHNECGLYIIRPLHGSEYKHYYRCGVAGRDAHISKEYTQNNRKRGIQSRFLSYNNAMPTENASKIIAFLQIPLVPLVENLTKTNKAKRTHISLNEFAEKLFHFHLEEFHSRGEWYKAVDVEDLCGLLMNVVHDMRGVANKCTYYRFKKDTYITEVVKPKVS